MTTPVTTIRDDQNVRRAIEIINSTKIGALPDVDDEGEIIGIVTEGGLLRRICSSSGTRPVLKSRDRAEALVSYIKIEVGG